MKNTKLHKAIWFAGPVLSNLKVHLQCKEDFLCVRMRSNCPCRWAFLLVQATVRNQGPLVCLFQMKPCAFYKNSWYFIRIGGRVGWSGVVQPVEEG